MSIFTGFTDLPAEMRNMVYHGLLPGSKSLALLRTSKLIHQEAAPYFYQHNLFTISLPATHSEGATILPPIANRYLKYLRQLTICMTVGRPGSANTQETARSIAALTGIGANLDILNFRFSSKISTLLQSRVDDSVLHNEHPITYALRTLLTFDVAKQVRVELDNVWFATDVIRDLRSEFGERLGVLNTIKGENIERPLTSRYSTTHLHALGVEEQDAEYLQIECLPSGSTSSSLDSALSELDTFSPMDFLDEEREEIYDLVETEKAGSGFRQLVFGINENEFQLEDAKDTRYIHASALDNEELNESDDVDDEEMEGIDDIDAIVGNLEELEMWRVNGKDVCYLTNFAPEVLGRRLEESA
ncbi:hypothetical protein EKO04_004363 [Ascochyta lentis]|uniref:F-box domain-containing protein n=1 Tax=Ascochyta lentis TaxID=205686 RepID=A0A8H7MK95_9PLEO|nr:hypothetical protein EKO04_004363 [Ascochyta lentis]